VPTYEYACRKCGIVEAYQSIKDAPLVRCPQCKRGKVTRLLSSGGGIIFKGSGFWETDYNRSSDYKSRKKAESGPSEAKGEPPAASPQPATKKAEPAPTDKPKNTTPILKT
jgi:putative FmdB family regulatory protein